MKTFEPTRWLRVLAVVALAAACGSSAMGGGIAGTSSILGAISGFGSVIVGDIEFDTSGAEITIEGDPVPESALELGMVAFVRGVVEPGGLRGAAELVAVENLAEAPIESIDREAGRLRLLSQDVLFGPRTVFSPSLDELAVGDTVDVGGFLDANGRIRATRIAKKLEDLEIELRGFLTHLDPDARLFRINDLLVDFSDALLENAPAAGLEDGLFVEIEADAPPLDDVFLAVGVTVLDPALPVEEGDGVDIQGFVTAVLSSEEFVVNEAQKVRVTAQTRFERGDASDVVVDAEVEVSGFADATGVLVAAEVEIRSPRVAASR